jgi:hypothetical protein
VLSGVYRVVLQRDGTTYSASIRVNADRHVVASDRDEQSGYDFLRGLYAELSRIDDALNVLDNLRLQLPARAGILAEKNGDSVLIARLHELAAGATALEAQLTSQPENSQDNDFLEDRLRERLTTLIDDAPRGTPPAETAREGGAIVRETDAALERYRSFIATEIMPLQHRLARDGAALDLAEKPAPEPKPGPDTDERADRRDP